MKRGGGLRILHLDKFGSRTGGGATAYMLEMVRRQRERGHSVEFLATRGDLDEDTTLAPLFPPRPQLSPLPSSPVRRMTTAAHMVWNPEAASATTRAVEVFRPDIVHCHNLYHQLTPSVLRALSRARVPAVMTVHDFKLVCPTYQLLDRDGHHCEACVGGSVLNVLRKRCQDGSAAQSAVLLVESGLHRAFDAYRHIDHFLCPSRYMADLMRQGGFGNRVVELPYGYDLSDIPVRTSIGEGVVFAGRLSPEKGVDHLIRAMALVERVELTICGDGPERRELEALARQLLPGRCTFTGHLDRGEIFSRFRQSAVVVAPSVWAENQPLSIIEAMASGLPVIAGDAEALRELVQPGVRGLNVDPRRHDELAAAIRSLVDDRSRQVEMGRAGREYAEERHDIHRHLDALEKWYEQSMRPSQPGTSEVSR